MTLDKNKVYLFHNIYGDADELIKNAGDDIICVPFGWDEETENNRNNMLNEMGIVSSSLPSVIVWRKEYIRPEKTILDHTIPSEIVEAHWEEISLGNKPKYLWNWIYVFSVIDGWDNG
jgi:hypothetical protein